MQAIQTALPIYLNPTTKHQLIPSLSKKHWWNVTINSSEDSIPSMEQCKHPFKRMPYRMHHLAS